MLRRCGPSGLAKCSLSAGALHLPPKLYDYVVAPVLCEASDLTSSGGAPYRRN